MEPLDQVHVTPSLQKTKQKYMRKLLSFFFSSSIRQEERGRGIQNYFIESYNYHKEMGTVLNSGHLDSAPIGCPPNVSKYFDHTKITWSITVLNQAIIPNTSFRLKPSKTAITVYKTRVLDTEKDNQSSFKMQMQKDSIIIMNKQNLSKKKKGCMLTRGTPGCA